MTRSRSSLAPSVRRRPGSVAAIAAITATWLLVLSAAAAAAPVDDQRQQATELQDQIEASDITISGVAEQLHAAEAERDDAQRIVDDADARIQQARTDVRNIRRLVRKNAVSLYHHASNDNSLGALEVGDADDLNRRNQYADTQAQHDNRLLDQLAAATDDLALRRDEAEQARAEAAARSAAIAAVKAELDAARAHQQALLDQVNGELAATVAAERARREQAARAQFSSPVSYPDVGPPNGSASQAIAWARGVIGSGYSLNPRMGPTYDCSGLTHMAWRAAGVIIPSTSGSQYAALPHVPLNAVQPGDLIFWGPNGSDHVALYTGGGMIIDASSSQGKVVERPIWGNPSGAARVV
ncbi:MAG: NlpC/P60 family protein [Acidimicrobiia bacterium]